MIISACCRALFLICDVASGLLEASEMREVQSRTVIDHN